VARARRQSARALTPATDLTAQCDHVTTCFEEAVAKKRAEQGGEAAMEH